MSEFKNPEYIRFLTLGFFDTINADIRRINKIFEISIPENYSHIFGRKTFAITFDSQTAHDSNAEFITIGNEILSKVINLCKSKGPITTGVVRNSSKDSNNFGIRFYFNILFQGIHNFSNLSFVDLDIKSSELIQIDDELDLLKEFNLENINFESMPSLYINATKLIRKKYEKKEIEIKDSTFEKREKEIERINDKYKKMVDETEEEIKEIERIGRLENEKHKLYDEKMEKIQKIRREKENMTQTISAKFKLIFSYDLVSVVIFSY